MALSLTNIHAAIKKIFAEFKPLSNEQAAVHDIEVIMQDTSLDPNTSWLPFKKIFDAILNFPAGDLQQQLRKIYNEHIPAYVATLEEALTQATSMPANTDLNSMMEQFQNSELGRQIQIQMEETMGKLNAAIPNLNTMDSNETMSATGPQSEQEMLVVMAKLLNEQSTKFYTELSANLGDSETYKELRRMLKEYLYLQKRVDAAIAKVLGGK